MSLVSLQEDHHTQSGRRPEWLLVVEHMVKYSHKPAARCTLPRHAKAIGVTQSLNEFCSYCFRLTALEIEHFPHLLSQGQEHGFVGLGRGLHILHQSLGG